MMAGGEKSSREKRAPKANSAWKGASCANQEPPRRRGHASCASHNGRFPLRAAARTELLARSTREGHRRRANRPWSVRHTHANTIAIRFKIHQVLLHPRLNLFLWQIQLVGKPLRCMGGRVERRSFSRIHHRGQHERRPEP